MEKDKKTESKEEWETLKSGDILTLEEGESVKGAFISMEESKAYPNSYALKLNVEGEQKVLFVPPLVKDKIVSYDVVAGEIINILYIGKKKSTLNPKWSYKDYEVMRKKV